MLGLHTAACLSRHLLGVHVQASQNTTCSETLVISLAWSCVRAMTCMHAEASIAHGHFYLLVHAHAHVLASQDVLCSETMVLICHGLILRQELLA